MRFSRSVGRSEARDVLPWKAGNAALLPPLQGEGWGEDGVDSPLTMLGQTNQHIRHAELQRKLRKTATPAEQKLWMHLRAKRLQGFKFRRQHPFGDYILDFVCMEHRLIVEVDGSQHLDSVVDPIRDATLEAAGFRIVRFWNHDVLERTNLVLTVVLSELTGQLEKQHHPLPSPPLEGEGERSTAPLLRDRA